MDEKIKELIGRRRRQILVHSIIYYRLNDNLIPDSTWAAWAVELKQLQDQYPEIAKQCCYRFYSYENRSFHVYIRPNQS